MIKKTIEILTAIGLIIPCICELLRKVDDILEKTNAKMIEKDNKSKKK